MWPFTPKTVEEYKTVAEIAADNAADKLDQMQVADAAWVLFGGLRGDMQGTYTISQVAKIIRMYNRWKREGVVK